MSAHSCFAVRKTLFLSLAAIFAIGFSTTGSAQDALSKKELKRVRNHARNLSLAFNSAAETVRPCTVEVLSRTSKGGTKDPILSILADQRPNFDSFGTGVIVSDTGVILTNHHVVENSEATEIRLIDGRRFKVKETITDPQSDLAVLQIEAEDLPFAEISEEEPFVGQWVLAIGNPFMLDSSVSAGIISSTKRFRQLSQRVQGQFLQTDASVNPGNSGGPLIDLDGKLVGINTAIASRSGSFEGIGFAIPIKRANWIRQELLSQGKVRRGYAGISVADVAFEQIKSLKLKAASGALVRRLVPGYAAKKAGLEINDVIVSLDGQNVRNKADFSAIVQQSPIGEPVEITVMRAGEKVELSIELTERRQ